MADNVTVDNAGLTDYTVSSDEAASGQVQRVKLAYSADGADTHIPADADGLLVNLGTNNDVTVTGSVTADTELTTGDLDTGAGTDTRAVVGLVGADSGGGKLIPGTATDGLLVNLGANNDVTVTGAVTISSGSITADTELPAAAALGDNDANPTTPTVGAALMVYDGTTWDRVRSSQGDNASATGLMHVLPMVYDGATHDRMRGDSTDGLLVNLGANNDVTVAGVATAANQTTIIGHVDGLEGLLTTIDADTSGLFSTVGTPDIGVPAGVLQTGARGSNAVPTAVSTDGDSVALWANRLGALKVSIVDDGGELADVSGNFLRVSGNVGGEQAHDSGTVGNPVVVGWKAVSHGADPTAVAAGDLTYGYANRDGIPFVLGGHMNTVSREYMATTAQTDDAIITVSAGTKIVVTAIEAMVDKATSVDVGVRIGFGTANVPTEPTDGNTVDGVVLSHPGIAAGSGVVRGDGSGILAIGGDDQDLRITNEVPTSGKLRVLVTYFTIES